MRTTELLVCPVCGGKMSRDEKSLFCLGARRHVYDVASSGYVNLLPPGRMSNAKSGDDRTMISSRAAFLDRGYYSRFSERIGELISSLAENQGKREIALADCACGEGYHTCNITKTIVKNSISPCVLGFDASKFGAERGAKRAKKVFGADVFFAAANVFSLPVADSSVDFATSIFAPVAWDETSRILKDDGYLIVASSGERHLFELRAAIYDEPREASGVVRCADGFLALDEEVVTYKTVIVSNADVMSLFSMTPFYYKTSKTDAEKLLKIDSLEVTVEVKLTVFGKK